MKAVRTTKGMLKRDLEKVNGEEKKEDRSLILFYGFNWRKWMFYLFIEDLLVFNFEN